MMTKTTKAVVVTIFILLVVDWLILRNISPVLGESTHNLPTFTLEELSKYDGNDKSMPIYLALDGYVYDVSAGRDKFYAPGSPYHELVGKDSSILLHVVGSDIIKKKYKVVGVLIQ